MREYTRPQYIIPATKRKQTQKKSFDKILSRLKTVIIFLCVIFLCTCILVFPSSSAGGVKQGLVFSSEILIPSLFPFMVLSAFVVKSSLAARLGRFLNKSTQLLFNLPGCTGPTILLSLIGGYPTGARGVKALLDQKAITLEEGNRMMRFAVGAGPAFVISVVGAGLLKSSQAGIILFVSQVIASILIGIISGILSHKTSRAEVSQTKTASHAVLDVSTALVESCYDATTGILNMCAFVIIFSAIIRILNDCGVSNTVAHLLSQIGVPNNISNTILPVILEVTSGCSDAAKAGIPTEIISFAVGWAGICVHFQISSSLKDLNFSKSDFTLFRFIHGILAAVITHVGFMIFPQARAVINTVSSKMV